MDLAAKAQRLLELHHQDEPLVLVNAWDAASARIVEAAGFAAVATTSAGIANSLGYRDGEEIPAVEMFQAVRAITRTVSVPVSADLEAGYGNVLETALALLDAGAVGLNFEDFTNGGLTPLEQQVDAIRTIRRAGENRGVHIVINARCDVILRAVGEPDSRLEHMIHRLRAYSEAGADSLFAPLVTDEATISALVKAVPKPLNILVTKGCPSVHRLRELGVKRVSLGGGPMRAAMSLTKRIARAVRDSGTYESYLDDFMPTSEANKLFSR